MRHVCSLIVIVAGLLSTTASAWSCRPIVERHFYTCTDGACEAKLVDTQMSGHFRCERRHAVLEVDRDVSALITPAVQAAVAPRTNGLFEVTLFGIHGGIKGPILAEDLARHLDYPRASNDRNARFESLSPDARVAVMDEVFGVEWRPKPSRFTNLEEARTAMETRAGREFVAWIVMASIYWVVAVAILVLWAKATLQFFERLHGVVAAPVTDPFFTQAALAVGALFALLSDIEWLWPLMLLLPVAVFMLPTEAVAWWRMRRRQGLANRKPC